MKKTTAKKTRPKEGQKYYYIEFDGVFLVEDVWWDTPFDRDNVRRGNYFRTKREAKPKVREIETAIRKILKGK